MSSLTINWFDNFKANSIANFNFFLIHNCDVIPTIADTSGPTGNPAVNGIIYSDDVLFLFDIFIRWPTAHEWMSDWTNEWMASCCNCLCLVVTCVHVCMYACVCVCVCVCACVWPPKVPMRKDSWKRQARVVNAASRAPVQQPTTQAAMLTTTKTTTTCLRFIKQPHPEKIHLS